jgi:NUMOD4 motif
MRERWKRIDEYELTRYSVSDHGNVKNANTGQLMSQSLTPEGTVKVGFVVKRNYYTRLVKNLVALAFVDVDREVVAYVSDLSTPLDPMNLAVINIDGDQLNNHYQNLAWRPRWYAWKYARQFHVDPPPDHFVPLINLRTGERFENTMEAGISEGLLWEYVIASAVTGHTVFPSSSVFAFA